MFTQSLVLLLILSVIGSLILVEGALVNWSTLNATELNSLSPLLFKTITTQELASIPGGACLGFTRDQVMNLNNESCGGFTDSCMTMVNLKAINGLTGGCVSVLPVKTVSILSSNQMSNISVFGISGFTKQQVAAFNPNACAGISGKQIEYLSYDYHRQSCSGFLAECLSKLSISAVHLFNAVCFSEILPENIIGFKPNMFEYFSKESLRYITGSQLVQFVRTYGNQFVNGLVQKQLELVEPPSILRFKEQVVKGTIGRMRNASVDEIPDLSWLQLSVSTVESLQKVLTIQNIPKLNKNAMMGFLSDCKVFPNDFFAAFSISQLNYLLEDTISGLTLEQIESLPPQIFEETKSFSSNFKFINLQAIQGVTIQQLRALLGNSPGSITPGLMNCAQFNSLSVDQLNFIKPYKFFTYMKGQCGNTTVYSTKIKISSN